MMRQRLARAVVRAKGFEMVGEVPQTGILVGAPHTSNWDFPLCILAMFAIRFRLSWLGKHTLFRWPVTGLLRWLGGEPIERTAAHGTVASPVEYRKSPAELLSPIGITLRQRVCSFGSDAESRGHSRGGGGPVPPGKADT